MTRILTGLIQSTGDHDAGKTIFALECGAQPERICFLDDDIKGRATVNDMRKKLQKEDRDFGAYHDLVELATGKRLLQFHMACLQLIDAIPIGKFDVIVWDTWTRFGSSCRHYVATHMDEFRRPGKFSQGGGWADIGSIKGAEMNKEALDYEAGILNRLLKLAPTVIVVTHLKSAYIGRVRTDKLIPASSRMLERIPRLRIWLRQNPTGSAVPIGLVLKRVSEQRFTERGIRSTNILPRKLVPRKEDESLWDTIWWYWDNPMGNRRPTPEETPDEYELSILNNVLTEDQRYTLNLLLKAEAGDQEQELKATPQPPHPPTTLAELKARVPLKRVMEVTGLTLPQIGKDTAGAWEKYEGGMK